MCELERLRLEVERAECLRDSAYKAGLKAGWNLAVSNDEAGYQAAMESTEHIAELKRIREAIRALSEQSRLRGEAEGKLAALEIAGVVDGWKSRAEAAEARVKELEARPKVFCAMLTTGVCNLPERVKELEERLTVTDEMVERAEAELDALFSGSPNCTLSDIARAALTAALEEEDAN